MVAFFAKNSLFVTFLISAVLMVPGSLLAVGDPACEEACKKRDGLDMAGGGDLSESVSGVGANALGDCQTAYTAAEEGAARKIRKCDSEQAKKNKKSCEKKPGPEYEVSPEERKRAECRYRCEEGSVGGGEECARVEAAHVNPGSGGGPQPVQIPPNMHAGRTNASQTVEECVCIGD